jgi:hypothetical protein
MMNTKSIREAARDVPVFEETEVLVAGGGMAGCAAALAAARAGAKVVLLERNGCLGGVATASMMGNIGNRFVVADGTQVVKGIAAEIVERLAAVGAAPRDWRKCNGICMDSERLKIVWIDLLEEAGVTTLTHSMAAMPILEGDAVRGCFFESKSGRLAVTAANTVDCTGEADLAHRAGADVREHRASSSLLFKFRDVDIDRFLDFLGQDPSGFPDRMDGVRDYAQCAQRWRDYGLFFFPHHGGKKWRWLQETLRSKPCFGERRTDKWGDRLWWKDTENVEALGMYTHRRDGSLYINTGYWCFDTIDVRTLSRYELQAQQFAYVIADYLTRTVPGFEKARVEQVGVDLGLRGGRYIRGRATLTAADFVGSKVSTHKDDVIATAPITDRAQEDVRGAFGSTCDIPFGSCVPQKVRHLLVGSGKSVDAEGGNNRLYRGMSGCMNYGQAAGAAAALASRKGLAAGDLPIRDLQRELLRQGVRLGDAGRLAELGLA